MNTIASYYIYIPSIIVSLFLAFYILLANRKDPKNIAFFLLTICGTIWLLILSLSDSASSEKMAFFWSQTALIPAACVPAFFLIFSTIFPKKILDLSFPKKILLFLPALTFSLLAFTHINIIGVQKMDWGTQVESGPIYYFIAAYYLIYLGFSFYFLIKNYLIIHENKYRSQILYVATGLAFTLIINVITNAVLVSLGNSRYGALGTASMLIFLGLTIYAMVKKSLFDIKLLLTNAAIVIVVGVVAIQTVIQVLASGSSTQSIISIAILGFVIYGGIVLSRSVKAEIKKREEIQILARELKEANQHLEELDKVKDDFLSMASHELNTPIAAIEGYLSMILVEKLAGELPPKAKTYLDSVYSSSQRLAHLVRDLLNVSRIESGRIHLLYEQKPIEDIINQAIMEITPKVREAKHTLTFEKPAKPLPITWLDATRITEIMINIIGNAIKYTDPGGKIDIKALADDQKIVVSVADNGRGIPKERQDAIFQKFTQADVLKDQAKGTGLGMYISKKFIELHKGQIWFHSDGEGKGTTFFISLPIVKVKPVDEHEGEGPVLH